MFRRLYIYVLRLHPRAFRRRFSDEMLSIFDHSTESTGSFRLILDGIASLARQWTLRHEFWIEHPSHSPQAATDGIPSFSILDPFRPKAGALFHGLLLSSILFAVTCFAIKYSWIHLLHVRVPEVQWENPPEVLPTPLHRDIPEPVAEPDEGPLSPPTKVASAGVSKTTAARIRTRRGLHAKAQPLSKLQGQPEWITESLSDAAIPAALDLEQYVGIYVVRSPRRHTITIAVQGEQLLMKVDDRPTQVFIPVSASRFVSNAAATSWIEFSSENDGPVRRLEFFDEGKMFTAIRRDEPSPNPI